jgi:hypothetical protein
MKRIKLIFHTLESMSQKSKAVLYRYLTKFDKGEITTSEEGEIDPSYVEVEKVLDCKEEEVVEYIEDVSGNQAALKELEKVKEQEATKSNLQESKSLEDIDSAIDTITNSESKLSNDITSETAKTPNQIFQPVERCRRVLDRIWEDFYSASFQDPVDTTVYEDYLDIIEEPICLSDIRQKLDNGEYSKYMAYKQFAQDVRKVWRNCKQYNDYHSSIWLCANYLSMYFERLYQSWVISFGDGTIPMSHSLARPWETSCRVCLKDDNDEKMILCDHCDAAFHVYCLKPPMSKVPEDAWMCRRCLQWLAKSGAKVLSATAEEEAKKMLEGASVRKTIRVKKRKYLVKWRGLSYRDCTWETKEDIKDDEKIEEYHKINDAPPEEPPLTQAEIGVELAKDRKQILPSGFQGTAANPVIDLDAEIYAQIRTYHFLKWNKVTPDALMKESGSFAYSFTLSKQLPEIVPKSVATVIKKVFAHHPISSKVEDVVTNDQLLEEESKTTSDPTATTTATTAGNATTTAGNATTASTATTAGNATTAILETDAMDVCIPAIEETPEVTAADLFIHHDADPFRLAVSELLGDMVYSVARDHEKAPINPYPSRPLLPTRFQIPSELEICATKGSNSLCMKIGNYNNHVVVLGFKPDKNQQSGPVEKFHRIKPGDFLVAINGIYVHTMKFDHVVALLNMNLPYMYLRFLRIPRCVESKDPKIIENYFEKKDTSKDHTNKLYYSTRSMYFGVFPVYENHQLQWEASYYRHHMQVMIGRFTNEFDAVKAYEKAIQQESVNEGWSRNFVDNQEGLFTIDALKLQHIVQRERNHNQELLIAKAKEVFKSKALPEESLQKELNGFHSDDGLDSESDDDSFGNPRDQDNDEDEDEDRNDQKGIGNELKDDFHDEDEDDESASLEDESDDDDDDDEDDDDSRKPKMTSKKSKVGWKNKLSDTDWTPKEDSFEDEGPIKRLLRAVNECAYPPIRSDWVNYILELGLKSTMTKQDHSSNMKGGRIIEQVDLASNQVIRTWKSMLAAAKTFNIPIADIYNTLKEERDSAGGYRWRYGEEIPLEPSLVAGGGDPDHNLGGDDPAEEERKDDSWLLKLPTKSKDYRSGNTLREYQVEGLNWLLRCWYLKRSSILADVSALYYY